MAVGLIFRSRTERSAREFEWHVLLLPFRDEIDAIIDVYDGFAKCVYVSICVCVHSLASYMRHILLWSAEGSPGILTLCATKRPRERPTRRFTFVASCTDAMIAMMMMMMVMGTRVASRTFVYPRRSDSTHRFVYFRLSLCSFSDSSHMCVCVCVRFSCECAAIREGSSKNSR